MGEGCGFFQWADEGAQPKAGQGGGRGGGASTSWGGGASTSRGGGDEPLCQCGEVKVQRTVNKEGDTKGRQFWTCPRPRETQCQGAFQWSDEVEVGARAGGQPRGRGAGRGGGVKRGREEVAGGGEKKQRKCGLCHELGHTRTK